LKTKLNHYVTQCSGSSHFPAVVVLVKALKLVNIWQYHHIFKVVKNIIANCSKNFQTSEERYVGWHTLHIYGIICTKTFCYWIVESQIFLFQPLLAYCAILHVIFQMIHLLFFLTLVVSSQTQESWKCICFASSIIFIK